MTTHNAPTRTSPPRALAWLLLLPLLVSLTPPVHAAGLRARLNSLLGRKQQAQAQIRVAKQQPPPTACGTRRSSWARRKGG
jgi:hypothetical protein